MIPEFLANAPVYIRRSLLAASVLVCSASVAPAQQLPEGNGKELVQAECVQCHDLQRTTRGRHTPDEWRETVNQMVTNGATLSKDQAAVVTEYLAKNYPAVPKPKAVAIPGPVEAAIKEWTVPTPNTHPHDPQVAPHGYQTLIHI